MAELVSESKTQMAVGKVAAGQDESGDITKRTATQVEFMPSQLGEFTSLPLGSRLRSWQRAEPRPGLLNNTGAVGAGPGRWHLGDLRQQILYLQQLACSAARWTQRPRRRASGEPGSYRERGPLSLPKEMTYRDAEG